MLLIFLFAVVALNPIISVNHSHETVAFGVACTKAIVIPLLI